MAGSRGAPRLRRGAPSVGGVGGHFGAPMSVVLLWHDAPADYLRAAQAAGLASSVELLTAPQSADPPDDVLARTDAMLAWRPPARLAARAPRLRWIQSLTGGCEQWLGAELPAGVTLTCARGTHRVQMS